MAKLFKKEDFITAFDIDSTLVKIAQITISENKRFLYRLHAQNSPSLDPEDISKTIHNLATKFKISNSLVLVNLPRHMVTVREIEMPSVSPEEIEGMVSLQSSKLLPYSKDEIIYSYKIEEVSKEGYSRVMLVLAHKDVINKLLQPFKQNGIEIHRIALGTEALTLWYLSKQAEEEKKRHVALVDIDSSSADIQITHGGSSGFSRAITFTPEDRLDKLINEIRRSFFTYKKTKKVDISKLVLTGAESIIEQEAPTLKKEFKLPTVYVNPMNTWPLAGEAQLPTKEQRKKISFATVLSLAFSFDKLSVNLLPPAIQKAKTVKVIKETLIMTALLGLCIFFSFTGIIWKKMADKTHHLRYVNSEIKKTDPRVSELTSMINNIKIIKQNLDMRGSSIDIIRELYKLIPGNISLTILDFEIGSSCTLRGTADELSSVFRFITILEDSPYLENVKVRYATKRAIKNKMLTDFEIVCELTKDIEVNSEK